MDTLSELSLKIYSWQNGILPIKRHENYEKLVLTRFCIFEWMVVYLTIIGSH